MFVKDLIQKYKKNELTSNLFVMIWGTGIAQGFIILISPLLSRLFSNEDFSTLGVYMSIYSIVASFITLKYEAAILLPKKDKDSKILILASVLFAAIISIILFFIILLFHSFFIKIINNNSLSFWIYIIPLSAFFLAITNILINWYNRKKKYLKISSIKIFRNTSNGLSSVALGFYKIFNGGLIISQILSDAVVAIVYLYKFIKNEFSFKLLPSKEIFKKVIKEYKDFPILSLPATFINTLSLQLPILLISGLFSSKYCGDYFFSYRILALPISLIGASYSQIFFERFVKHVNKNDYLNARRFLLNSWKFLFMIAIIPSLGILIWGEDIFVFVFGSKWDTSGTIASILIIYLLFAFISSPTSTTFIALRIQKYSLVFSIITLVYRTLSLYIGYIYNDFFLSIKILVILEVIEIFIYNFIVVRKLNTLISNNNKLIA